MASGISCWNQRRYIPPRSPSVPPSPVKPPTLYPRRRYFARALNPNGLEPPTRELVAIRQARAETSRYLSELLEFAQARLLDYARLVAADGISRGITSGGEGGGASSSLLSSCVFELQRHG